MDQNTHNCIEKPLITTKLLRRAIQSVLDQTYPLFQLNIYDNASGDETRLAVENTAQSDPRVKYYCHSNNIGEYGNFQYGLKQISTPFFSILADDDYVLPDFYKTALAGFNRYPESMFSATDVIHLVRKDKIFDTALEKWPPAFYPATEGLVNMLKYGPFDWTGILFRREILDSDGYLDGETGRFHDLDFMFRIAAHHPFTVSSQPGAVFDWSDSENRSLRPFEETWPGVLKMIQNLTQDKEIPPDVRAYAGRVLWRRYVKGLFIREGVVYLSRDKLEEAQKVADLLHDPLGQLAAYLALKTGIGVYQYLPFTRKMLKYFVKYRKNLQIEFRNRNNKYKHLLPYIR
jgi:glycosyltransferase involved in cell wall biosynthesis